MKALIWVGCLVVLACAALVGMGQKDPSPDAATRALVLKLYQSLDDEQKKMAVKEFADKDRYNETFPAVQRPGVPFTKLSAEQKTMVADVVKAICSEYGAARCLEIAKQDGEGQRIVTFFGTPTADGAFGWRFAQHHLTLVHVDFAKDKPNEFGPILLGGNPVKTLWDEEEKIAMELYGALSPDDAKIIKGKGNSASGSPVAADAPKISELSEKSRALAKKLLDQRLAVFSADRRRILDDLIQKEGGVDSLRISFWGDGSKSQRDGGNYHWRIGAGAVLADWQTVGKDHIHMTLRAREKK